MNRLPTPAERQKEHRAYLKRQGYKRLDLYLSGKLLKNLMPYIKEYGGENQPGQAIIKLLEACVKSWGAEPE